MSLQDFKDTKSYSDILNEDTEKKLNRIKVLKKYIVYINNFETNFDYNSSSFTGSINPYYEEFIKKKKSNNINLSDTIKLEDTEIVKDLNEIFGDGGLMVRILDFSLYVDTEKFNKHDKVVVKHDKDEYNGTIACVDTQDIVIKTRDGKRNRIDVDSLKSGKYKLTRLLKQ